MEKIFNTGSSMRILEKLKTTRLALVCPRYKPPLAGGAEVLIEKWAKRLSESGHQVDVLTTCSYDHTQWKNEVSSGLSLDGKIQVRRFKVKEDRNLELWIPLQHKMEMGYSLNLDEEIQWMKESVHSPGLYRYLEDHKEDYDWIMIAPYLFGVSYQAATICPEKTIMMPCLHDEIAAKCQIFGNLFHSIAGLFFNTDAEKELAVKLHQVDLKKCFTVGMGIHIYEKGNGQNFRDKFHIKDPFILYAGRRESGKNVPLLLEYFTGLVRNSNFNWKLVFLGSGDLTITQEIKNDVIDVGYVSEEDKKNAFNAATVFCQPSLNESFSIVLLESWLNQTPALVHQQCPVTRNHCIASNGGLYFDNFFEFYEIIHWYHENPAMGDVMGSLGREYVINNYDWNLIDQKFYDGINQILNNQGMIR